MAKNDSDRVTLVKDGFEASVPATDKVEINQLKARGFTVKGKSDPTPNAPTVKDAK